MIVSHRDNSKMDFETASSPPLPSFQPISIGVQLTVDLSGVFAIIANTNKGINDEIMNVENNMSCDIVMNQNQSQSPCNINYT